MEYVVQDPDAKVRAGNIRATLDAFLLVPSALRKVMEANGLHLEKVAPDEFVPLQPWLNTLRDIAAKVGPGTLRSVGMQVIHAANFPPSFDAVEAVLLALDDIYHLNNRGEVGHYHSSRLADGSIEVRCETPFPRAFERGLIEGISQHHRLKGKRRYTVAYEEGPPGGEMTCRLVVRAL